MRLSSASMRDAISACEKNDVPTSVNGGPTCVNGGPTSVNDVPTSVRSLSAGMRDAISACEKNDTLPVAGAMDAGDMRDQRDISACEKDCILPVAGAGDAGDMRYQRAISACEKYCTRAELCEILRGHTSVEGTAISEDMCTTDVRTTNASVEGTAISEDMCTTDVLATNASVGGAAISEDMCITNVRTTNASGEGTAISDIERRYDGDMREGEAAGTCDARDEPTPELDAKIKFLLAKMRRMNMCADDGGESEAIPICTLQAARSVPPNAVRYDLTIDSGAGESVAPKSMIGNHPILPSAGSIAGQKFVGPGGEIYYNQGKASLDMINEKGRPCVGEFQVTDGITKPLAAVSDSCDKGNLVLFDSDNPCIIRRESTEGKAIRKIMGEARDKTVLHRKNGVYVMPMWVVPAEKATFRRQGA